MPIGRVVGAEIKRNRDGERDRLVLICEITDGDDVQSVEVMCGSGEDWYPPDGNDPNQPSPRVLIVEAAGAAYALALACDDGVAPSCSPGERKIYSVAGGTALAVVYLRADGHVELNGHVGTGTAVEFKRLQTAFNQLKSDFDNHVHPATGILDSLAGACTGATSAILVGSTADIDPAESATVHVP